ncbi:hypothetical protein [Mycolicibacterium fluoranthenivorans]|uniref:hypothetical protein n=1 Tax=Mycolicibacterium fluoranthenivorans TaxID=258505 RepID=UPI001F29623B|nr:hypothetical protein [Mycolicibacterium fluoranthenivorans]
MTTTETQTVAETADAPKNLRVTRREAAAKKAPAKAATTTAPAAEAPAMKAPAKLRWSVDAERKGGKDQTGTAADRTYSVKQREDGTYLATVAVDDGTPETLSETTFAKAYAACVAHNRAAV